MFRFRDSKAKAVLAALNDILIGSVQLEVAVYSTLPGNDFQIDGLHVGISVCWGKTAVVIQHPDSKNIVVYLGRPAFRDGKLQHEEEKVFDATNYVGAARCVLDWLGFDHD